jgi:predicted transcriptional regulator
MMNKLTSKFISTLNDLEQRYKAIVSSKNQLGPSSKNQLDELGHSKLLDKAAEHDRAVRQYKPKLKRMARLRNFLVHDYNHANDVLIPTHETVKEAERLLKLITEPPSLLSIVNRAVQCCLTSDSVAEATRLMRDNLFSQLPVKKDKELIGLLTGGTVARWLATLLETNADIPKDARVSEVMKHSVKEEAYALVPRNATVFDALGKFDDRTIHAVIVTESAQPTAPLGIVTPTDIPKLIQATKENAVEV